jgi:hypothetical protein
MKIEKTKDISMDTPEYSQTEEIRFTISKNRLILWFEGISGTLITWHFFENTISFFFHVG